MSSLLYQRLSKYIKIINLFHVNWFGWNAQTFYYRSYNMYKHFVFHHLFFKKPDRHVDSTCTYLTIHLTLKKKKHLNTYFPHITYIHSYKLLFFKMNFWLSEIIFKTWFSYYYSQMSLFSIHPEITVYKKSFNTTSFSIIFLPTCSYCCFQMWFGRKSHQIPTFIIPIVFMSAHFYIPQNYFLRYWRSFIYLLQIFHSNYIIIHMLLSRHKFYKLNTLNIFWNFLFCALVF